MLPGPWLSLQSRERLIEHLPSWHKGPSSLKDWNKISIGGVTFSVLLVPLPSVWMLRRPRKSEEFLDIFNLWETVPSELGIAFYPQVTSKVRYNISLQQTRRESKPLTLFSKQSSLDKRWRRALWAVSQKLPTPSRGAGATYKTSKSPSTS